ncbi:hypothetical protein KPG71_07995 [Roseovarius sp. PS-C2]|uniref:hypothetical protein n=1 Tax=Roseovarius sp. PS-C2 TaxID=2820814 RepID=UPI001C0DE4CD|nr:hypothetical protein [Roseovarius sp. PS-C2]MBU3259948.1 hypothetical protein [Roseovarius sp. PS-C2]
MTRKIIEILKAELSHVSSETDVSQESLDRLDLIVDAALETLPRQFKSVFSDLSNNHSTYNGTENIAIVRRLIGILQFADEIKSVEQEEHSDNLIPTFEISPQDKTRIVELCEKMRRIIFVTADFDEPHRLRLLNRIAAIEAEIHKPKGMFDVVRGGINDIGETLGKFGKDIKPLTERMKEVVSITRKGTKAYDQLPEPEDVKRLPSPENDGEEE